MFISVLLLVSRIAYAGVRVDNAVPEASVFVLAPAGIATVVALERRRRRLSSIKHGVGLLYFIFKRAFDIIASSFLLLLSFPVFAIVALLVRMDSPGPVLFKRRVIGKHGKSYDMYKFRSMADNAESLLEEDEELRKAYYVSCKIKDDPRVTKIGKILRKTSLDELPQLLNVFLGSMTFVGPRPIHNDEVEIYGPCVEQFKTVTPGITGIWQTCGRSETSYETRVEMDMLYIQKRSILFDLWIILNTVPAVLLKRGAC
jgi:lipopolysaccharide/colanic/teichoic acid biosynthesis glycosyltransferase